MSDNMTFARPYAQAIFEYALESNTLAAWSEQLRQLAYIVNEPVVIDFLTNPVVLAEQKIQFLLEVSVTLSKVKLPSNLIANFLAVLSANQRLLLLDDIFIYFEQLRAEKEKTLVVDVLVFDMLDDQQKQQLVASLEKRLSRKITLNVHLDGSILGGAIICAGDLVIDGSIRGKLNKLANYLAA